MKYLDGELVAEHKKSRPSRGGWVEMWKRWKAWFYGHVPPLTGRVG